MSVFLLLLLLLQRADCSDGGAGDWEKEPHYWNSQARRALHSSLMMPLRTHRAKNIILFLGDGMGVSTVSAARILRGQMEGLSGEETILAMDTFPHVALSKTYCVDRQVSDSASTATAYHCGVKANAKTLGLSAKAVVYQCNTTFGNEVFSVLHRAKAQGKSVGIVTTTRVQHASPAGAYAHSVSRSWYSDADLPSSAILQGCTDIATQLVTNTDIDVILGGGRMYMTPEGTPDPEYPSSSSRKGDRKDKRNLINVWLNARKGRNAQYVWNKEQFNAVNVKTTDCLMGLFEPKDMKFEAFRNRTNDPSIVEMTEKAIRILSKNPKGFFLFVEDDGRIDHGHHGGVAKLALTETVMLDRAIQRAAELTHESDTLTVVTADHSHVFTFGGNTPRGNPIFGLATKLGEDDLPFTSILYANGPGYTHVNGSRENLTAVDIFDDEYMQQAAVPLEIETHGGEDVAIYAKGPMAHLFHGVQEQSYVAHAMAYAACLEPYTNCPLDLHGTAGCRNMLSWTLVSTAGLFWLVEEQDPIFWHVKAKEALHTSLSMKPNTHQAKNLILFLGDGMGISTVTAARVMKGQMEGKTGEESILAMDTYPYLALSKTYNVDQQMPDSAGTATAYLCGVKANYGTLGLSAAARRKDCSTVKGNEVKSILHRAKMAGKSVGVVSTARVQHASPAASYSHTPERGWYSDKEMSPELIASGCTDIAYQLVHNTDINVILGGGRQYMFPKETVDPEYSSVSGSRLDKTDLVKEWLDKRKEDDTDYLMGLFEPKDTRYELERNPTTDPSLTEMVEKAIKILRKNPNGVSGRIDHGHHAGQAKYALTEAVEFDRTIARAGELTSELDTLSVVTADHSHVFSFGGYSYRGNPVLGISYSKGEDGKKFTNALYGNGPGYQIVNGARPDVNETISKTHGSEDVAIFAKGPMAHLFHGVQEQSYIPHAMAYAACLEPYSECHLESYSSSESLRFSLVAFLLSALVSVTTLI
ncbi:hypothetical protein DNTS_032954 [Danionella cerebrum]|uniref:Alkaline phosphatase n=1 Tax=Danionella cerebrum TaxID=2873325 RepID=A0A553Q2E7_9TELE|nr:hypothetical protein DNTS_032954 [Danionella translucida]